MLLIRREKARYSGFSLIEMAIVLFVIGLLFTGLITPLTSIRHSKKLADSQDQLERIRTAIIAYSIKHGRLPCPDKNGDGLEDNVNGHCDQTDLISQHALPSLTQQQRIVSGNLPFLDLGTASRDSYGNHYLYTVSLSFADIGQPGSDPTEFPKDHACPDPSTGSQPLPSFSLCSAGGIEVRNNSGANFTVLAQKLPFIVVSQGNNAFTGATHSNSEQENQDNDRIFIMRPTVFNGHAPFDDTLMWVPAPVIALYLLQAGRLP